MYHYSLLFDYNDTFFIDSLIPTTPYTRYDNESSFVECGTAP